jgi:hypothetical protein
VWTCPAYLCPRKARRYKLLPSDKVLSIISLLSLAPVLRFPATFEIGALFVTNGSAGTKCRASTVVDGSTNSIGDDVSVTDGSMISISFHTTVADDGTISVSIGISVTDGEDSFFAFAPSAHDRTNNLVGCYRNMGSGRNKVEGADMTN